MDDRREPKHVESEVEGQIVDPVPPGARAIGRDIVRLRRNIQRHQVRTLEPADDVRRQVIHHQMIGEVRQRMAERR